MKYTLLILCSSLMVMQAQVASAQTLHYTSKQWRSFSVQQNGKKLCYIASLPTGQKGNYSNRGEPFVIVTHRSAAVDEVSVSSGYPYKEGQDVKVTINGKAYGLFAERERAWAKDAATDAAMVAAMKSGSSLVVHGTSQRGTYSQDSYSLSGFTAAYNNMKTQCR